MGCYSVHRNKLLVGSAQVRYVNSITDPVLCIKDHCRSGVCGELDGKQGKTYKGSSVGVSGRSMGWGKVLT